MAQKSLISDDLEESQCTVEC